MRRDPAPEEVEHELPLIEARGISKSFDKTPAVVDLDLAIQAGEFFGFLGPNGSGKSTTIGLLTTMLLPDTGSLRVAGFDPVTQALEVKRQIGVLPEEIHTYERLSIRELIEFSGRIRGIERRELRQRGESLMELMELAEKDRNKLLLDCSMGMRKKAVLSSAIVHKPRVLFLDEPFNGIDARTAVAIRHALDALRKGGTTVFFSSHILELVEKLCTRIAIVEHGRIRAEGTLAELQLAAGRAAECAFEEVFLALLEEGPREGPELSWLSSPSS